MDSYQPPSVNRAICTIGCICCARLIAHNETCICWKPVSSTTVSTQTDPGISYGYTSNSYFTRGNAAHSMLHASISSATLYSIRAVRSLSTVSENRHATIGILREMFPEISSSPRTNRKLHSAIRRANDNKQYYRNLKNQLPCPVNEEASEDLITYNRAESEELDHIEEMQHVPTESTNIEVVVADIHHVAPVTNNRIESEDQLEEIQHVQPTSNNRQVVVAEIHHVAPSEITSLDTVTPQNTGPSSEEAVQSSPSPNEITVEVQQQDSSHCETEADLSFSSDDELNKKLIYYCQHY
ncbi:unnamed protein product [Mytilus coruscus]|uniref:Uncharacterized protein n=1 Tax=Mytilus coruscus TaxID=42192 RepID=A0A6J8C8U4_MYTCO|nr:unnamed protein product [Mytilus coruscus]